MELACKNCAHLIPEQEVDWVYLVARCPECDNWNSYPLTLNHPRNTNLSTRDSAGGSTSAQIQEAPSDSHGSSQVAIWPEPIDDELTSSGPPPPLAESTSVNDSNGEVDGDDQTLGSDINRINAEYHDFAKRLFVQRNANRIIIRHPPEDHRDIQTMLQWPWIRIDKEHITVLDDPSNNKNPITRPSDFKQFYVKRINGIRGERYGLYGVDWSDRPQKLLEGELRLVLVVESEIEKFLGIKNVPVAGAMDNPYQVYNELIESEQHAQTLSITQDDFQPASYLDTAYGEYFRGLRLYPDDEATMIFHPQRAKKFSFIPKTVLALSVLLLLEGSIGQTFAFANLPILYSTITLLLGSLGGAYMLDFFLNADLAMVDDEHLYLSARPYPFLKWGRKKVSISGYKQFYVSQVRRFGIKSQRYGLFGIDDQGNSRRLLVGDEKLLLLFTRGSNTPPLCGVIGLANESSYQKKS